MSLFQKPPATPEAIELSKPLDLSPDEVAKIDEDEWYARAYRGDDAPQLTVRAALMGAALGVFLALTNLYIGLKTGFHLGVALTACILSFSIHNFLRKIGVARTPMGILENNCMQSTASSAGYSTGNTLVSAIPALLLISGEQLPWPVLAAWVFFLAVLGVVLAIPMKRSLINKEKLRFPSGTAAAVTLQSLYSKGEEALVKARALLFAALGAGVLPIFTNLNIARTIDAGGKVVRGALLPGAVNIFDWLPGIRAAGKTYPLSAWNIKLDYGLALIAAGALVGLRVTISMLAAGLGLVLFLGPAAMTAAWTNPAGTVVMAVTQPSIAWKEIGIWLGAPIMISSGLLSFAFQWRTIVRAFQGFRKGAAAEDSARVERLEVPMSWFAVGGLFAGAGVIALANQVFAIPIHFGALAVALTFVLSLVACRTVGESDVAPTGAMGKIMQLTYGVLIPQDATANLMTAGITAGASGASADLLTDLKAGYLLGANPRRQFVAQLMGVIPGTLATVVGFYILVPNAAALSGENPAFSAPAAQSWLAVAKVFKLGFVNMHPMTRQCIFVGLAMGVLLVLLERALPKYKKWLPSPTGVGLGLILPFHQLFQMFLGALIAAIMEARKGRAKDLVVPIASGMIAGESIIGVVVQALNNFVLK